MSGTVKIDAIGVAVAAEVYAKPGDTLLLFNGICIGVQRPVAKPDRPPKAATLLIEAPKGTRKRQQRSVDRERRIVAALADGPLDTSHLLDRLKIDVRDSQRRLMVQYIGKMARRGVIKPTAGTRSKGRKTWQLVRVSATPPGGPIAG